MGEAPAPFPIAQSAPGTIMAEGLRQRQLDRLALRGSPTKALRVTASAEEVKNVTSFPAQPFARSNMTMLGKGDMADESNRIKRYNEDAFETQNSPIRSNGSFGEAKRDGNVENANAVIGGKQFTISKVGNNGRIYLRPRIRPAHQRYPQPPFAYPNSSPNTAGLDEALARKERRGSYRDTMLSADSSMTTPAKSGLYDTNSTPAKSSTSRHRRTHSYSTVDDQRSAIHDSDLGAFKVVIERPSADGRRPKTSGGHHRTPTLEVPIPSYKLGTPRFSNKGTPFMRGSSYAGTEVEYRSSFISQRDADMLSRIRRSNLPRRSHSIRQSVVSHPGDMESTYELRLPPTGLLRTSPNIMPKGQIVPEMYDALTYPPRCEDRSVIRRMSDTDLITAATPARLVAEVTQELSYELVASFFITYRSYISGSDLLLLVMARLEWGIDRAFDGLVVSVRCFTVIRHWLVNFFADDFVLDYDLRVQFCGLVNTMVKKQALLRTDSKTTNDILSNIKRLWRDSCAVYWDGPEFACDLDALVPIAPGGIAGSRNPQLTPKFWDDLLLSQTPGQDFEDPVLSKSPMVDLDLLHDFPAHSSNRFFATVPPEFPIEFNKAQLQQASLPRGNRTQLPYPEPLSPRSITSVEALSCSIPPLSKTGQFSAGTAMGAHPVTAASQSGSSLPVAHTPKALRPKSYRPGQGFQRHRSVSNSSRPDRTLEVDNEEAANGEAGLTLVDRFAGSLVRGLVFPPGHVYLPTADPSENRPISLPNKKIGTQKQDTNQQGMGMKRMFGTVRRAVSTKADNKPEPMPMPRSPLTLGFPGLSLPVDDVELASLGLGGMGTEHAPLQTPPKPVTMRPDILSKFVESDFEKAIEQHKVNAAKANENPEPCVRRINVTAGSDFLRRSLDKATLTACSTSLSGLVSGHRDSPQPLENTSFLLPDYDDAVQTQNNTSFLLDDNNDGYVDRDITMMSGALPSHLSTDAFTETFNNRSVAPTPPVTPPEIFLGSPRRSSHILGNYSRPPAAQAPSLTLETLGPSGDFDTRPLFRPLNNPSMHSRAKRHKPRRSTSLRRIASFHSGYTNQMTERSFDATSISDSVDRASIGSTHAPGNRVLRRRPGGDLRAVKKIGELPLRRHRSSGSLTTYSDSLRSSYLLGGGSMGYGDVTSENNRAQSDSRTFSVGALADPEGTSKPRISLLSTSSKPALRPSFQAEAAKLAQIPDDTDDDGGVEAALLKLEGRYEKRKSDISSQSLSPKFIPPPHQETYDNAGQTTEESVIETEKHQHRHNHIVEKAILDSGGASEADHSEQRNSYNSLYELQPTVYRPPVPELPSIPRESQNSIPLLQRDGSRYDSDDGESRNWRNTSILLDPSHDRDTIGNHGGKTSEAPVDVVDKPESLNQVSPGDTIPRQMSADESFLQLGNDNDANNYDDYDDNHSDLSSEMSLEEAQTDDFLGNTSTKTLPPVHPGAIITEVEIPPTSKQPKEPSMTMEQALLMSPPSGGQYQGPFPPSPDITPTYGDGRKDIPMRSWYSDDHLETQQRQNINEAISTGPLYSEEHMPFILHFDSHLVAEQFTLIEKEALGEIHFRELLEMKWSQEAASACLSWPRFLEILQQMEEDDTVSHGIEICGARSNIMTQWAISQVILTQDINERARTIAKLIEIATHCRQMGNYATLFQLTVAVSNPVIAELHETWKHVPAAEVQSLREFEELIQPANNFRRLRDEMESVLGKRACIPLVVIYAKDLTVLKDMPSYIASTPTDPPLINVSKCRAQATVVQLFSRYLESSTGYKFQTVPGLTDRCLWIAGLSQTEVRSRAELLV